VIHHQGNPVGRIVKTSSWGSTGYSVRIGGDKPHLAGSKHEVYDESSLKAAKESAKWHLTSSESPVKKESVELDEAKTDIYHKHMLKALGKSRLPKDHQYTSAIATNGDFVVKDGGGRTVGRIVKGEHNLKEELSQLDEIQISWNHKTQKHHTIKHPDGSHWGVYDHRSYGTKGHEIRKIRDSEGKPIKASDSRKNHTSGYKSGMGSPSEAAKEWTKKYGGTIINHKLKEEVEVYESDLSSDNLHAIAKDHDIAAKKHSAAVSDIRTPAAAWRNHEAAWNKHYDAAKAHREAAKDKNKHSAEHLEKLSNRAWDHTDHIKKHFDESVEQMDEVTRSAIKRPVQYTDARGITRTRLTTTRPVQHDQHGQEKIRESVELDEAFKAGIEKLNDGSTVVLKKQDAELLNSLFKDLNPVNKKKMMGVAMKDKAGFEEILGFAREAL
jgi:hypothetical protein